jgi:hypothetical protein
MDISVIEGLDCMFLRHGLLESFSENTCDYFFLSKVYFNSDQVAFKKIYLFDIMDDCLRVHTKIVISKVASEEVFSYVPFSPREIPPNQEDGNIEFEVGLLGTLQLQKLWICYLDFTGNSITHALFFLWILPSIQAEYLNKSTGNIKHALSNSQ